LTVAPEPSDCVYVARIVDKSEGGLPFHQAFASYHLNPKRKFFHIETDQAIALLRLMAIENVIPQEVPKPALQDKAGEHLFLAPGA
jgi:hypothetical protein